MQRARQIEIQIVGEASRIERRGVGHDERTARRCGGAGASSVAEIGLVVRVAVRAGDEVGVPRPQRRLGQQLSRWVFRVILRDVGDEGVLRVIVHDPAQGAAQAATTSLPPSVPILQSVLRRFDPLSAGPKLSV